MRRRSFSHPARSCWGSLLGLQPQVCGELVEQPWAHQSPSLSLGFLLGVIAERKGIKCSGAPTPRPCAVQRALPGWLVGGAGRCGWGGSQRTGDPASPPEGGVQAAGGGGQPVQQLDTGSGSCP